MSDEYALPSWFTTEQQSQSVNQLPLSGNNASPSRQDQPREAVLWEALCCDTGVPVATLTVHGIIIQCNQPMADLLQISTTTHEKGISLTAILPPEVANERIVLMGQINKPNETVTIDGMLGGTMVRTIYRAIPSVLSSTASILMVCTRISEHATGEPARRAANDDAGMLATLTNREREILHYIGLGLTTAQIAKRLKRSTKTIEGHRVSLGVKLKATNRVQLARIAIQAGLSPLPHHAIEPKPISTNTVERPVGL